MCILRLLKCIVSEWAFHLFEYSALKGLKPGLTVWGEMGSLLEQGADDTMKTSSAPRSSSVNPLQERSTSAFSELSAVAMETEKQTKIHNKI